MTAATEVDLEAWVQGEIEVPCEHMVFLDNCVRPAEWLGYVKCVTSGCEVKSWGAWQVFSCASCKEELAAGRTGCAGCWGRISVTWIERIKR